MSYTPGMKLSYANDAESATVLTNDQVMITTTGGNPWRERMSLADWLILAGGNDIVVKDIRDIWNSSVKAKDIWLPVSPVEISNKQVLTSFYTMHEPVSHVENPKPVYPPRTIRTKLRWNGGDHTRTAIVIGDGILEVKRVSNGLVNYKKTFFESEAEWRASLTSGVGSVTVIPYVASEKNFQKNLVKPLPPGLSDVRKLIYLQFRFKAGRHEYGDTNTISVLSKDGREIAIRSVTHHSCILIATEDDSCYETLKSMHECIGLWYDGFDKPQVLLTYKGKTYSLNHFF